MAIVTCIAIAMTVAMAVNNALANATAVVISSSISRIYIFLNIVSLFALGLDMAFDLCLAVSMAMAIASSYY